MNEFLKNEIGMSNEELEMQVEEKDLNNGGLSDNSNPSESEINGLMNSETNNAEELNTKDENSDPIDDKAQNEDSDFDMDEEPLSDNEDIDTDDEEFDLSLLEQIKSTVSNKTFGEPGVITIVNPKGNTKVFLFAQTPFEKIGNPKNVQFLFYDKGIVVGAKLPNATETLKVGNRGAKKVVYFAKFVEEVTKRFSLDYSNGRVSRTFNKVSYKKINGEKVALYELIKK